MKYLKEFKTENDYLTWRDSKDYLKPNVSLCDDNGKVHYNFTPPPPKTNGHDYVDLGLPSGTLWATCNVGADKPSDYGLYFQWGDTSGYTADQVGKDKQFNWPNYKWYLSGYEEWMNDDDLDTTLHDYLKLSMYILSLEDDAANKNWGGDWRMPSKKQCQELLDNTISAWTTSNSVSGVTFTSKKDASKSIFIPAAGYAIEGTIKDAGSNGYVWSAKVDNEYGEFGQYLGFNSKNVGLYSDYRTNGYSIRGVIG